jgi:hypothetical protein
VKLLALLEEYAKHSALNFGQVLHGALYLGSHPDIDEVATRGSFRHRYRSALLRGQRLGNDLFFALIPPHWHHTPEELRALRGVSLRKWFFYGFAAWRFTESGEVKPDLSNADPRWDPRCKAAPG